MVGPERSSLLRFKGDRPQLQVRYGTGLDGTRRFGSVVTTRTPMNVQHGSKEAPRPADQGKRVTGTLLGARASRLVLRRGQTDGTWPRTIVYSSSMSGNRLES